MKKICIILLISFFGLICSGQKEKFNLSKIPTIKKGNITFYDGNKTSFSNLSFKNDSVFFSDSLVNKIMLPLTDVDEITKSKSLFLVSTGIGLVVGFLGGIVVAGIARPQRTVDEWVVDQIEGNEGPGISKEQWPIVGIGTACGAGLGAVTGLFLKKEKIVYKKPPVDVFPGLTFLPDQKNGFLITIRININ